MSTVRNRIRAVIVAAGAATAIVGGLAAPASAHEAPKSGSTCAMSGMTEVVHGSVYVCRNLTAGAKPRWDAGHAVTSTKLTMSDGWVKSAKKGQMSAAFGTVTNPTDRPITVIAAISPASAALQLHEVVSSAGQMVMQQKTGGLVVPAKGSVTLKPGGNHIMYMKLTKALRAGTTTPLTLVTADGGTVTLTPLVKVYKGANESYDSSAGMSGM